MNFKEWWKSYISDESNDDGSVEEACLNGWETCKQEERERCAQIAENFVSGTGVGYQIARLIRKGE